MCATSLGLWCRTFLYAKGMFGIAEFSARNTKLLIKNSYDTIMLVRQPHKSNYMKAVQMALELLAAIPSVIYGLLGLMLSAILVLAINMVACGPSEAVKIPSYCLFHHVSSCFKICLY